MAKRRGRTKKKKKQRFEILAPQTFNEKEVGVTIADDPKNLLGRTVSASMKDLTGNPGKQYVHFKLRVKAVRGGRAVTRLQKMEVSKSYLARMTRKGKSKLDKVFDLTTADGKSIRIKILMILRGHPTTKQKRGLHHALNDKVEKTVNKLSLDALTKTILNNSLPTRLKKMLKKIAPVTFVTIRMLKVKQPKKEREIQEEPKQVKKQRIKKEPKKAEKKKKKEEKGKKKKEDKKPKKKKKEKPKKKKKEEKKKAEKKKKKEVDYSSMTKAEVYEKAQELDVSGRSTMNKKELIKAVKKAEK